MRKRQRQAISLEINLSMIEHGLREVHVKDWSGGLASASLTVVFMNTTRHYRWDHQNMKTLFDLVAFFNAEPENVRWHTDAYNEYGSMTEELHLHFSKVDLTCFNKNR